MYLLTIVYVHIYIHIFKLDVQECGKMYIHVHRSLKGMEIDDFAHEAPGSFIGIPGFGEVPNLDTGMAAGSCKGVGQPDVRSVRRAILCSKCWPGNTLEGPLQLLSVKPTGPVFPIFLMIETAGHSYCVSKNSQPYFPNGRVNSKKR